MARAMLPAANALQLSALVLSCWLWLPYTHGYCFARPRVRDAKILTSKIREAETAAELLVILDGTVENPIFNDFHASSACCKLSSLHSKTPLGNIGASPVLAKLGQRLQQLVEDGRVGSRNPRSLANVFWAVANLGLAAPALLKVLSSATNFFTFSVKAMNARDLSNSLWATAQLQHVAPEVLKLVPSIAAQLLQKADDMVPQHLSNSLWAAAKLYDVAPDVLKIVPGLVEHIPSNVGHMTPQGLSNSVWATAKLQAVTPDVLQLVPSIAKQVPDIVDHMKPQEVSNCLWAAAQLQDAAPDILRVVPAVVAQVVKRPSNMNSRDLSNNLWAVAKLQDAAPEVLRIAESVPCKAGLMNPQELSNIIWAAAKMHRSAPMVLRLVPAVAVQIAERATDMDPQEVSNSIWAAARLRSAAALQAAPALVKEVSKFIRVKTQDLSQSLEALLLLAESGVGIENLASVLGASVEHLNRIPYSSDSCLGPRRFRSLPCRTPLQRADVGS